MFSQIITALGTAFGQVVDLVSAVFVGGFDAIGELSSGLF